MVMIPKQETTMSLINSGISEIGVGRGYMGLSGIGEECIRKLQYSFRMAFNRTITNRVGRIFRTGDLAEDFIIADLNRIGIEVWDQQFEVVGFAGHWLGHIDGRCIGVIESPKTPHLLELKTYNQRRFNAVCKHGVLKNDPGYYDQVQIYMYYLKYKRSLFVAYSKNTSEYYVERIKIDSERIQKLIKRQQIILFEEYPAKRIGSNSPDFFKCKMCDASELCFKQIEPLKNCGTCKNLDVYDDGVFKCAKNDSKLTFEDRKAGCELHRFSEFFTGA